MRLPWALSLGLFWYVFSQGVYHGLFLGDIFRELFRMNNLQGVFCGGFFRAISFEAVSPGFLSQRRHLCTHPQELFPCASLEWFFACPLSQELLRVFYLVLSSVSFPADQFCWRLIAGVFALRFCARPLLRAFFRKAFSAHSFAGLSPWVIPRCTFRANFRMDGFHGLFREVVYSVLSAGWIFGSIFSGSFSVQFFAGKTSMGAFAGGFFCALFRKGFVCAILCRNFLPALFGRVFFRALFGMCFSRGPFRAAFTVLSFVGLFSLALFRSGDIDRLIPRSFSCALPRSGFFGTLFRRSFCRALFCRGFFHDRFQKASSALSSAGIFPWVFRRGISCALFCMDGFQ